MTLWTTGIILMVLGAIYVLQLLTKGVHCCLKRLWASGSQLPGESLDATSTLREHETSEEEGAETGSSEISALHLRRRVFGDVTGERSAQSSKTPSGSDGISSVDVSATLTLQSSSQSGSVASMTLQSTPQSGSQASISQRTRTQSGSAASLAQPSTSRSGSQLQSTSALNMTRQSGSQQQSASSLSMPIQSGTVAVDRSSRVSLGGEIAEPHGVVGTPSTVASSYNRWNAFQHAHKGKGWGTEKMRAEYYKTKSRGQI